MPIPTAEPPVTPEDSERSPDLLLAVLSRLEANQARLELKIDELIKLTETRLPTEFRKFAHT